MKSKIRILAVLSWIAAAPAWAQGTISGRVLFEGAAPEPESVTVVSDTPTCGTHQPVSKIVVGPDGGVAWAVVRVLGAEGEAAPKKGTLDQVGCQFEPPVQVLPTGSTLVITSSDPVLHNAHAFREDGATAFNVAVPMPGIEISKKLDRPGVLRLRCDAGHTWMKGYIVVLDEPHHAVTDGEGRFVIENVPAGRYDVEVWQEWTGRTIQSVDVVDAQTAEVTFTLRQP